MALPPLGVIFEKAEVRRETVWKYETGATKASIEVLVNIIKLVIIPDELS